MDVKDNYRIWNSEEHWETGKYGNGVPLADGEKWSAGWGNSTVQWRIALRPRIAPYLPAGRILEIACGRGRWGNFLRKECEALVLVDLADTLVAYCKQRFAEDSHISYIVNDGRSLPGVEDASVDFLFSYDSLVHVDLDTMGAYVAEAARVLAPGGTGFVHHSNLAAYAGKTVPSASLRDPTVSAEAVRAQIEAAGMKVISQELVPWMADNMKAGMFIDSYTTFAKTDAPVETRIFENRAFEAEKHYSKFLSIRYPEPGTTASRLAQSQIEG